MTPLFVYQELCRLAGALAIFTPARRPGNLPGYQHDQLGECFDGVMYTIRRSLEMAVRSAFERYYFEGQAEGSPQRRTIDRLQVGFVKGWRDDNRALYLGVEGVDGELSSQDCQALIRAIELKQGGASTADAAFHDRLRDLELIPVDPERRPRVLPPSFVYYRLKGEDAPWLDVINSKAMFLRFNPTKVKPEEEPGPAPASASGSASVEPDRERTRITRTLNITTAALASRKVRFALFIV
jgi:type VI secretion system protein ImpJ